MMALMGSHRVMTPTKDKYLDAIEKHCVRILEVYSHYEEKKPIILFDVTEGNIYAYPYREFKKDLNLGERASFAKQYNEALREEQFVVFVRDSQEKKLISYSIERPVVERSYGFESNHELMKHRIRRPGGGRKLTEEKDPMTEQKWIRSSLRRLSERLAEEGHQASVGVVARLLKQMGFSLKANQRKQGRSGCPDRDEQFKYIASQKQHFITAGLPIISIDTKKKELIGDFRNKGRTWRRQAEEVNEHDFSGAAKCRAVPFGIYDPTRNQGYVYVGVSNDTPEFAVCSIVRWWDGEGRRRYKGASALLILADSGGSNGCRARAWKLSLQEKLCDESGLTVTVCHYPTGCSKWNPVEHRLFSFISKNWEGKPLRTLGIMLGYIRGTTTATGLKVKAFLDEETYKRGQK